MNPRSIRIAVADDHPVVREGLCALLGAERDFEVVGQAGDGSGAVRLAEEKKPDVLVLDLMMPGLGGMEVIERVIRLSPETRVVVLSMHANEAYVHQSLRNGAAGYVVKDAGTKLLVRAVRQVVAGKRFLSPPLTDEILERYARKARDSDGRMPDPYDALTAREREVLHLAAEGLTSAAIAGRLSISQRTAEVHRSRAMKKLDLHSQGELVRYAISRGLVPVDAAPRSREQG
jgi:DNA-binding NarL/FixJ family response regulator